ncbi:MAG: sensor histidine kinase [Thermosynechococcaceae cyanobacterium]
MTVPLLLKLEWMLLGFTALTVLLTASLILKSGSIIATFVWLTILSIVVLALMRLKEPSQKIGKVFYTLLELLVLILPSFMNGGQPFLPLMGLVIVMRGCQRFEGLGRIIVAGSTFSVFGLTMLRHPEGVPAALLKSSQNLNHNTLQSLDLTVLMLQFNAALSFGMALFFVMLLINALIDERQSRAKLVEALEHLRQYSLRIEDQSALQERNRIAREIHDSLGHTLTAQSIQLDSASLLQYTNREEANEFLQEAKLLCKQALQEVRQSVAALRTDPFRGKSLKQIATVLVKEFRVTTAIEPTCTISINHPIPSDLVAAFYRVLQEALTNISRHSAATDVVIQLFTQYGALNLQIQDNGKGFDPTQNSTGFGLQGMKERITALGGQFELTSQLGAGCQISIQVPLVIRLLHDSTIAS